LDGKRVQEDLAKLSGEKTVEGKLSWVALQDTYFAAAFLPKEADQRAFVAKAPKDQGVVGLLGPKQNLPPGGELTLKAQLFAGPRDLVSSGCRAGPRPTHRSRVVDFLARPPGC
jgi:YidC/Oxa1 family membrane protein insertase